MVNGNEPVPPGEAAKDVPPTIERVTVEDYMASEGAYVIYSLHMATYEFAVPYVTGRRVLDLGCGTGYGTVRLATAAREIIGVDVSERAIDHARRHYAADTLSFRQIGPLPDEPLPFGDDDFDVVLAFQVIEHIKKVGGFLDEVRRVLRPDGVFLCVTPDRTHRLGPHQRPWNRFHVIEYRPEGLVSLLRTRFADVTAFGMTAPDRIIGHELRRYRRARVRTYPFTFPAAPEWWRSLGLKAAERRGRRRQATTPPGREEFGFGPAEIVIAASASPSVNIVAIARGSSRSGA